MGGIMKEKHKVIATYDYAEYMISYINYYLESESNLKDFKYYYQHYILKDHNTVGNLKLSEITKDIVEECVYMDDFMMPEDHYRDFENDMDYFHKYVGKEVFIEGINMGWQNRSGEKTITLTEQMDLFNEIIPENTDLTYYIYKLSSDEENVYRARLSHHDSPMGEDYTITFKI